MVFWFKNIFFNLKLSRCFFPIFIVLFPFDFDGKFLVILPLNLFIFFVYQSLLRILWGDEDPRSNREHNGTYDYFHLTQTSLVTDLRKSFTHYYYVALFSYTYKFPFFFIWNFLIFLTLFFIFFIYSGMGFYFIISLSFNLYFIWLRKNITCSCIKVSSFN